MHNFEVKPYLQKILKKLGKRNPKLVMSITAKFEEIIQNPQHYKNLRKPLQHLKRVHITKNFVLTFSVDETIKTVTFEDYDHHDNIYN
jgi:YafQ family addiction module toxin component